MRLRSCKFISVFILLIASCAPARSSSHISSLYAYVLNNGIPNVTCNFESSCSWNWSSDSFTNTSGVKLKEKFDDSSTIVPRRDADEKEEGHFLFVYDTNQRKRELNITSPEIDPSYFDDTNVNDFCTLSLALNTYPKQSGNISVMILEGNRTKVIVNRLNIDSDEWETQKIILGHPEARFRIVIEIGSSSPGTSYVAIDNIELENCFPDLSQGECLPSRKHRCIVDLHDTNNQDDRDKPICIPLNMVCDIQKDCKNATDEKQDCDKVPAGARCTFENGLCQWRNTPDKHTLKWELNSGPTKNQLTGPSRDNTYANETGTYMYVDMQHGGLGSLAMMESTYFYPPPPVHGDPLSPHYNSCYVTFFYHKFGPTSGSLALYIKEDRPNSDLRTNRRLWWSYGNKGDTWLRQVVILPNITGRYTLLFEARKSMSSRGDVAIDDVSLSPRCFGIGIPKQDLKDYNYWEYPKKDSKFVHPSFNGTTEVYRFTTCGTFGPKGPTHEDCADAYTNTSTEVTVLNSTNMTGIQKWIVPETSFYTIIAKGARGGKSADALNESRSAMARIVTQMNAGDELYLLVGQEGQDACKKLSLDTPSCVADYHFRTAGGGDSNYKYSRQDLRYSQDSKIKYGGGGGGGGTYVFIMRNGQPQPLLVAAGAGGFAHRPSEHHDRQHGNGVSVALPNITAPTFGDFPAGAGGGWRPSNSSELNITSSNSTSTGKSLLEGGVGGKPCYKWPDYVKGAGGFGGGGGGCIAGGGGGGFTGGRAWNESSVNGEGGSSMVTASAQFQAVRAAFHYGPGSVLIIPAVVGCECSYKCVALDEARGSVRCVCPPGSWVLGPDNRTCVLAKPQDGLNDPFVWNWALILLSSFAFIILTSTILFLLRRCQEQQKELTKRKVYGPEMQLNNLNSVPQSVRLTEFNPNYEFGGATYTLRDLKEIPRDKIQLVKPLGCGAFGDVYQGLLRNRDTDSVDLAVAVKILPALCSNQAENDFLMEAIIMSKFNHPNIVHFIGACFDTHPRYIILELLAGGDLKNFLRENRPKADKPSSLTMRDLLQCAIDVAKGCQYLEELHFIHRDIAARNCLLTSRGPGRVVKIADFGMSRDIYRSDYYKKGGKAMLPIKWMPPEAFLDGIFSSKTDVWSFGVLLWEVMSLGFMPYTGIRNREVMLHVARGARLGAPCNCPAPVFSIMGMCWSQDPDERPNFSTIVERLGYCIQDPAVVNTQLPVYRGPLPSELDKKFSRSNQSEDDYVATDYMIPIMPNTPVDWKNNTIDFFQKYANNELAVSKSNDELISNSKSMSGSSSNSSSEIENSPKKCTPRKKPFTVSGEYVKDPKID